MDEPGAPDTADAERYWGDRILAMDPGEPVPRSGPATFWVIQGLWAFAVAAFWAIAVVFDAPVDCGGDWLSFDPGRPPPDQGCLDQARWSRTAVAAIVLPLPLVVRVAWRWRGRRHG